ncbi:DUF4948 family protein [Prevotella disiens]|nr:hypothetical protein [Prevotella disiens]
MPSDHQMLENFNLNESEFERLRDISVKYDRFHYPPYDETDSTAYIISYKDKKELDSLIKKLDIMSIQYDGISEVCLLFHTWGISVSGGYKEYIYAPNLEDHIKNYNKEVALDPTTEMYIVERITEEDLDQVSQRYSVNIELYRPIKNGWYIHLSREN